jgi:hypothetical protein
MTTPVLDPVGQSGVFDPDVLRKLFPAHPAAVVGLQQRLTTFSRYQDTTLRVLTQDLSGLLLRNRHGNLLRHFRRFEQRC